MSKKLALIPALALAIAGLGAAPAVASPTTAETEVVGTASAPTESSPAETEAPTEESVPESEPSESPAAEADVPEPTDALPEPEAPTADVPESPDAATAPEAPAANPSSQEPTESAAEETTDEDAEDQSETAAIDAKVTVDPPTVSQSEFYFTGVTVTVAGLEPGDVVTNTLTDDTLTARGSTVEFDYFDEDVFEPQVVDFTVTVVRGEAAPEKFAGSFTITDDEELEEGELSLATDSMSVSEFKKTGIAYSGEGFTPGETAFAVAGTVDAAEIIYLDENVEISEEGVVSGTIRPTETDDIAPGDYVLFAMDSAQFSSAEFTLTADEAQASLSVSPTSIEAADFINQDKGVTLTVTDCAPGADIRFVVTPSGSSDVTAYDNTVTTDETGTASVKVFGTSAQASAYVGDYSVTATCGDDTLAGAFSVTSGAAAGGSIDTENTAQLPRTGTELGGLTGGVALLLSGGLAIAMTMRRGRIGQSPTQF